MPVIDDEIRQRTVVDHIASGRTQEETCAEFEQATGIRLAERTLRSWIERFGPKQHATTLGLGERGVLADVLLRLRKLSDEIEQVLGTRQPPPEPPLVPKYDDDGIGRYFRAAAPPGATIEQQLTDDGLKYVWELHGEGMEFEQISNIFEGRINTDSIRRFVSRVKAAGKRNS